MTPTSSSGTQSSRFHTIDIRNAHEFENRSLETKNGARFVQDRGPVYLQMSKSDATRLPVELIDLISEFVAHTDIPAMSLTCKPWAKALARTHLHQKVRVTELAPALLADQGARVRACHYARLISADLGKAPPLSRLQIARQGHCRELREALANTSLIEHENKRTSLGSLLMERHRLEERINDRNIVSARARYRNERVMTAEALAYLGMLIGLSFLLHNDDRFSAAFVMSACIGVLDSFVSCGAPPRRIASCIAKLTKAVSAAAMVPMAAKPDQMLLPLGMATSGLMAAMALTQNALYDRRTDQDHDALIRLNQEIDRADAKLAQNPSRVMRLRKAIARVECQPIVYFHEGLAFVPLRINQIIDCRVERTDRAGSVLAYGQNLAPLVPQMPDVANLPQDHTQAAGLEVRGLQ